MKLYGGIDLHSNNSVLALLDEDEGLVYRKRLDNERRASWRSWRPTAKASWGWWWSPPTTGTGWWTP